MNKQKSQGLRFPSDRVDHFYNAACRAAFDRGDMTRVQATRMVPIYRVTSPADKRYQRSQARRQARGKK